MGDFLDKPSATPTNPSMIHLLSRHKDILYDYTKEFRRVKVTNCCNFFCINFSYKTTKTIGKY